MRWTVVLIITYHTFYVENRMIPEGHLIDGAVVEDDPPKVQEEEPQDAEYPQDEKALALSLTPAGVKSIGDDKEPDDYSQFETEKNNDEKKSPCSIMIVSNNQNPNMQSLLRKYRYDSTGVLIPGSVKYYLKLGQVGGAPILVELNDKAFSPMGGFIRYYKEVPPIPQSW